MIKLTTALLRKHGIVNPYDIEKQCGAPPFVFISYSAQVTGRAYRNAKWHVVRIGYQTDPRAHRQNNGHKTFDIYRREEKEPQRLAALAWATGRYGITDWVRDPFGDYHSKRTMDRLMEMIQTQRAIEPNVAKRG